MCVCRETQKHRDTETQRHTATPSMLSFKSATQPIFNRSVTVAHCCCSVCLQRDTETHRHRDIETHSSALNVEVQKHKTKLIFNCSVTVARCVFQCVLQCVECVAVCCSVLQLQRDTATPRHSDTNTRALNVEFQKRNKANIQL